jgi:hypothetical protein
VVLGMIHLKRNLHAFHMYLHAQKTHAFYAINVYHNYTSLAPIIYVGNLCTLFSCMLACNYVHLREGYMWCNYGTYKSIYSTFITVRL